MGSPRISVVVADDQEMVRFGFGLIVDHEPDMWVCGQASDGAAAIEVCRATAPDVVLMDIRMPGVDGIAATAAIRREPGLVGTHVIIVTTFGDDEYVFQALRAGASGFLLKDCAPQELVDAIRVVAAGEQLLDPAVTRSVIERFLTVTGGGVVGGGSDSGGVGIGAPGGQVAPGRGSPAVSAQAGAESLALVRERLSPREREIWALVAAGLANREIAGQLGVSQATVKAHLTSLFDKLGVSGRVQAVILAYDIGLVTPA